MIKLSIDQVRQRLINVDGIVEIKEHSGMPKYGIPPHILVISKNKQISEEIKQHFTDDEKIGIAFGWRLTNNYPIQEDGTCLY